MATDGPPNFARPQIEVHRCIRVAQARRRSVPRPMNDGTGAVVSVAFVLALIAIVNWWLLTQ